ncbi:MAG: SDR family NAD(P)-dependent oxidoreductase [Myxococcales bacterium]|nr:SDR family NAD(P)-dependent oxidoreductase [Myxococcales bacterium]
MELKGKVAFVTGAASGIGRASAAAYARAGADVVVTDLNAEGLAPVVEEIRKLGTEALPLALDVTKPDAFEAAARDAIAWKGRVDLVMNNAGVALSGIISEYSLEDWRWIVDVNLWGVVHGVHFFLPHMLERGEGHFVNVASAAGLLGSPGLAAYSTTKFAVVGLTESLRAELRCRGVSATVVCPGFIRTNIARASRATGGREIDRTLLDKRGADPAKLAAKIVAAVRADRPILVYTPEANVMHAFKRWTPWLFYKLLDRAGPRVEDALVGKIKLPR